MPSLSTRCMSLPCYQLSFFLFPVINKRKFRNLGWIGKYIPPTNSPSCTHSPHHFLEIYQKGGYKINTLENYLDNWVHIVDGRISLPKTPLMVPSSELASLFSLCHSKIVTIPCVLWEDIHTCNYIFKYRHKFLLGLNAFFLL